MPGSDASSLTADDAADLPGNPYATAGLIAGIASVVIGWFPLFGLFLTVPSLVLGLLGLAQAGQAAGAGRRSAMVAVVLSGFASMLSIVLYILFVVVVSGWTFAF